MAKFSVTLSEDDWFLVEEVLRGDPRTEHISRYLLKRFERHYDPAPRAVPKWYSDTMKRQAKTAECEAPAVKEDRVPVARTTFKETREQRAARHRRNAENHERLLAGEVALHYEDGEKVYTPLPQD